MRSKKPFSAGKSTFVIFIALLLGSVVPTQAQAQTFKVLHTFHGAPTDGANPENPKLVLDKAGNIYGTTQLGGSREGVCATFAGCGTVFKLDSTGKEVWLHRFTFAEGMQPLAGLTRDVSGNLYGTTELGGNAKCYRYGCGTVFELDKTGKKEKVLHKFAGSTDGLFPEPTLARDSAGNLYGTTYAAIGNIFKIDTAGKLTVLYTFTGGADGCYPVSGVILDAAGNLYGVAAQGGIAFCDSGYGTVFEFDTAGKFTVLHAFDVTDGAYPGPVVFDSAGNLYGVTAAGGNNFTCGSTGCGTVFELSHQGSGWTESVLYSFCSLEDCADGESPGGAIVRDSAGDIYGTAGGGTERNCNGDGCGVVFKLDASGTESVLHNFSGRSDGSEPTGLTADRFGNLFGTTFFGGDGHCSTGGGNYGCGVVFKVTP